MDVAGGGTERGRDCEGGGSRVIVSRGEGGPCEYSFTRELEAYGGVPGGGGPVKVGALLGGPPPETWPGEGSRRRREYSSYS